MKSTMWTNPICARRTFIGGSDARIIMGDDEAALLRLWREKRGEVEPEDLTGNLIVQLGTATEEYWLRPNLVGRGHLLDKLDQSVPKNHLARCHRDIATDLEILGADRLLAAYRALPVLDQVLKTAHQILSTIADGVLQQFGIRQQVMKPHIWLPRLDAIIS